MVIRISGHGGRRNTARVAKTAANSPVSTPMNAIRPESDASVQVTFSPCTTKMPSGRNPGRNKPPGPATVMTVAPSAVSCGAP